MTARNPSPKPLTRRTLLAAAPALALATQARATTPEQGKALIEGAVTVDMHSHAGALTGIRRINDNAPFRPLAEPMREGGMAVTCLAIVPDAPAHKVMADERIHPFRTPQPGELYAFSRRAFARLHALIADQGLGVIATAAQMRAASAERPSAIVTSEGGDFMEGDIARLDEAYQLDTLRHLQLTHYRVNELGDIQTEDAVYGGLTPFGAAVIRRCNALGIVVDVAHGTFDLVTQAARVTSKPLILSHTSLAANPAAHSRRITPEHARIIAGTGGVIGIWPPVTLFPDKAAMASGVARMVDAAGIDHVGIGSDMMGLISGSAYAGYEETPALVAALADRGFSRDEIRKLMGGNYARVFMASVG
jgi:membrane dipeptidase